MPELASLTIDHSPNKTTYFVGDRFERYGMVVKAHYDDGSSSTIDFYMCSPIDPLTINDTQITISFMDKSVTQSITVINPPSAGYFINKCLDKVNYGNNPYVNTVDASISFYNSPITIEKDSYQLNVILSYHSRMSDKESDLIKGFYKGFRTNYHQFLVKDGKDNDNNDIYKYIDGSGYIHTFLYNSETNFYHDKEGRYLVLNITNRTITDFKDNIYTFDTSGRLISIQSGLNPLDIKVIEYNSDGLRKIYDNRNPNVYIKFSYNFSFLLYIRAYYNNDDNPLKTYTFNGMFGQITSISESVGNNTRTLYEYLYNDREKVRRIVDHLNHTAYRLTYDFDTVLNDYRFNSIRQGYMSNDSLIEQKGIYFVRRNVNTTDPYKPIYELVIEDDNDIDTSFMSDTNGEPASVFESNHGYTSTYKTLSKEIGKRLSFQNNISTYGTINGKKAKLLSSTLTIDEGLSSTDLDSSEYVKLCGYIKIRADVQRAKLWLDGTNISTEYIDLNPSAYYVWQYFEIPFIRTKSNNVPLSFASFNLETRDENNDNFNAAICNLRFVKCEARQRLFFLNCNSSIALDEIKSVNLYKGNNTYQYDEYGNRRIKNLTFNYQYTRGNLLLVAGFNSFKYDYLGRRYSKNGSDGIIHRYYYEGSKLVGEDRSDGVKLRFFYDKTGLCSFRYIAPNSQFLDFYYIRNAFNDIVGIANGTTIVVRYLYDAWGNHQIIDNSNINIGTINPFRYKGYYYDSETNLYYLNSRYYDPEIGQFISPDDIEYLEVQELAGINLYAYCGYNPIAKFDFDGHSAWLFVAIIAAIYTVRDILNWSKINAVGDKDSGIVTIHGSHNLITPWMQWIYSFYLNHINKETRDIIKGSTIGVQYEWFDHNFAYYLGIKQLRADPVEIGKTIYNNNSLVVSIILSATYPIILNLLVPQPFNVVVLLFDLLTSL